MKTITVEQLEAACREQITRGNGKKKILISSDDEGNEFHELFNTFNEEFTPDSYQLPFGVSPENYNEYIVLG